MPSVTIRFYEELNDFLPAGRRKLPFSVDFPAGCTVKAAIEDLGVPHTEVDLVLVDGESVDFAHRLRDGDRIGVYPVFESFDLAGVTKVRPEPLRELRFVVDAHLGTLAGLLRMFGFDAIFAKDLADERIARLSREQARIVLTRDRGLLKRRIVTHGCLVRSRLESWYSGARCCLCGEWFGRVQWFDRKPGLRAPLANLAKEGRSGNLELRPLADRLIALGVIK